MFKKCYSSFFFLSNRYIKYLALKNITKHIRNDIFTFKNNYISDLGFRKNIKKVLK